MTATAPRHLIATLLLGLLAPLTCSAQAQDKTDFSPAERLLFMTNQLTALKPPTTLRYTFRKSGSMEEGFDDSVSISLSKQPDGSCCAGVGDFLTGARKLRLPEVPVAEGNPVILYFLEHDVREMQRLTKGSQYHFRKRIRMAVYGDAKLRELSLPYRGANVAARRITITPYLDDPLRSRFEKLATKQYDFTLSDAVPGGVYAIRTLVSGESASAGPVLVEEMVLEGASPQPPYRMEAKR